MRAQRSSILLVAAPVMLAGVSVGLAQQPGDANGPPTGRKGPPKAALQACVKQAAGAACNFSDGGQAIAGNCFAPQGRPLACRPANGAPGDEGRPANGGGSPVVGTQISTANQNCSLSGDTKNDALGFSARYVWSCIDGERRLTGNGIPDHLTGAFPNKGNPNRIGEHIVHFATNLNPQRNSGGAQRVKDAGFALNGIRMDPGTNESCTDDCSNGGRGNGGAWRIEALGQSLFDFGVDANNAHVQPGGVYHYHGIPTALVARLTQGRDMAIIAYAADGFPIYAPQGHSDPMKADSPIRAMRSSYILKSKPDAGRPPISMAPMGSFTQDYKYVAGMGDLDECNGRTDVTPEFPQGAYHYYVTAGYPYIQRCIMGRSEADTSPATMAPRQREDRARSRPPRERGQGPGGGRPPRQAI